MDYIINPMWIYWVNVLEAFRIAIICVTVFAGLLAAVGACMMTGNKRYSEDDEDYKMGKAIFRRSLPVFIVSFLATMFVPSEKILVEMLVARLATKQNIELTVEGLKQLVDYIAETIRSLK